MPKNTCQKDDRDSMAKVYNIIIYTANCHNYVCATKMKKFQAVKKLLPFVVHYVIIVNQWYHLTIARLICLLHMQHNN